jgi:hypothetical protein
VQYLNPYKPPPPSRPTSVTLMALLQFAKGLTMISVAALPVLASKTTLAELPDFRDLVFFASHGKDPKGLLLFVLGVYATYLGTGLWRLKRWARNSLMGTSGIMLVFYTVHFYLGVPILIMPAISQVQQQTVYILLLFDGAIFLYLRFHSDTYLCFPKRVRKPSRFVTPIAPVC